MAFLIGGANSAAADTAYAIENSLRLNSAGYLSFTQGTGNRDTFTFSFWIKLSDGGDADSVVGTKSTSENFVVQFSSAKFNAYNHSDSAGDAMDIRSNALHRDQSAWYHCVIAMDSTQGTEANRTKMYVNGVQYTSFDRDNYFSQNEDSFVGISGDTMYIGKSPYGSPVHGYLSEFYFIDGTQYAASNFGETNDDGIWIPKEAKDDLTFGTNGFFLEFKETGTSQNSSGIGADTSGEDNHLAVTTLDATDQCTDTPTNNFCNWNPLDGTDLSDLTFTEGNTKVVNATGVCRGTLAAASGKWYWEVKQLTTIDGGNPIQYGVADTEDSPPTHSSLNNALIAYSDNDAQKSIKKFAAGTESTVSMTEFTSISVNDIIMFAFDADTAKLWVGINGTWLHSGDPAAGSNEVASTNSGNFFTPCLEHAGVTYTIEANFGNPPFSGTDKSDANGYGSFEYEPPTGFYALCTKNLAKYG